MYKKIWKNVSEKAEEFFMSVLFYTIQQHANFTYWRFKKEKKRRKKGTANCNACNPVDSNKKTQKGENKSNNLKTAASKFKYSLIVGQQTKPSRYKKKKKKIYSMSLLKRISLKRFVNKISPRCLCNIRITISNFIFTSFIDF